MCGGPFFVNPFQFAGDVIEAGLRENASVTSPAGRFDVFLIE